MLGSAVTGGLSMAMDVAVRAPHGGIFVLFAVTNLVGYFIALAAGVRRRRRRCDLPQDASGHREPRRGYRLTTTRPT